MRALAPLAVLLLVGACVAAPPAPPPRQPAPAPRPVPVPPPPPPTSDWRDLPYSPGTWTYRRDARGSIALFGPVGTDAALTLRCDLTARQVFLSRAGSSVQPLTIRTSSTTRSLPVQPVGAPYVAATLAANDPILDAMGFSRGRFVVEQAGQPTLVLPAWAEIGRVTEDCRG